jgi:hypothetical protein
MEFECHQQFTILAVSLESRVNGTGYLLVLNIFVEIFLSSLPQAKKQEKVDKQIVNFLMRSPSLVIAFRLIYLDHESPAFYLPVVLVCAPAPGV